MDVIFLFLMKSFAIFVALPGQSQAEKPLRRQTNFCKISKGGGNHKILILYYLFYTPLAFESCESKREPYPAEKIFLTNMHMHYQNPGPTRSPRNLNIITQNTKGRNTRGDKSLQHVAATHRFVCSQTTNHMRSLQRWVAATNRLV